MNFKAPSRITRLTKIDKKLHIEKVLVNNGADKYCMKEETRIEGPFEFGVRPIERNSKTDWELVRTMAKANQIEDIDAQIYVSHYGNLVKIAKDSMQFKDVPVTAEWFYGPSGAGKSRRARDLAGDSFYPKLANKWWDGYTGQPTVILDDIGTDHKCLGHQLKLWSDRYCYPLEIKGGAIPKAFTHFIVTSQYSIDEIWAMDQHTISALKRRFTVTYFPFKESDHPCDEPGTGLKEQASE